MIQGLRLLPWVQAQRDEYRRNGDLKNAECYLECTDCMRSVPLGTRERYGCGWIAREDRTGTFPARSEWRHRPTMIEDEVPAHYRERANRYVCPGWLIRLPEVIEVARYYIWFDKGQLALALDGEPMTHRLRDLIEVFHGAVARVQSHMMDAVSKG